MSGYLDRLTRNILRPTQAVRPLAGSVFAPLRRRDEPGDAQPQPHEEEFFSRSDSPLGAESTTDSSLRPQPGSFIQPPAPLPFMPAASPAPARAQAVPSATTREAIPNPMPSGSNSPPPELPSINLVAPTSTQPFRRDAVAAQQPTPLHAPDPTASMPPAASNRDANAYPPAQQIAPIPLLPVQLTSGDFPYPMAAATNAQTSQLRVSLKDSSPHPTQPPARKAGQPTQPPPREPDEIHIHIGRIEVSAAAPAPSPRPTAPTRKGPSLEDYLKRSSSRTQ